MSEPPAPPDFVDPLDLVDPVHYARGGYPHGVWTRLRAEAPIARIEAPGYKPFWAITRHADIMEISRHPTRFSSEYGITLAFHVRRGADDRYLLARSVLPGDPRPCQWFTASDSAFEQDPGRQLGIYVLRSAALPTASLATRPTGPVLRSALACPH